MPEREQNKCFVVYFLYFMVLPEVAFGFGVSFIYQHVGTSEAETDIVVT